MTQVANHTDAGNICDFDGFSSTKGLILRDASQATIPRTANTKLNGGKYQPGFDKAEYVENVD